MSKITTDQVAHIAGLARIRIAEADLATFTDELSSILGFVEQLQDVDTSSVDPLFQSTGVHNALREDAVEPNTIDRNKLLECSPLPIIDHQIQTPSAHGSWLTPLHLRRLIKN